MPSKLSIALVTLFISVLAQPFDKKSDLGAFVTNVNNAGRLRYGKRSSMEPMWALEGGDDWYYPEQPLFKRALNADSLVASLNGAERLRFGRK